MPSSNLPQEGGFNNSLSSESNLDSQLTEAQTQIETIKEHIYTAMDELAGWMLQLQKLQEAANPFRAFIESLEMGEL